MESDGESAAREGCHCCTTTGHGETCWNRIGRDIQNFVLRVRELDRFAVGTPHGVQSEAKTFRCENNGHELVCAHVDYSHRAAIAVNDSWIPCVICAGQIWYGIVPSINRGGTSFQTEIAGSYKHRVRRDVSINASLTAAHSAVGCSISTEDIVRIERLWIHNVSKSAQGIRSAVDGYDEIVGHRKWSGKIIGCDGAASHRGPINNCVVYEDCRRVRPVHAATLKRIVSSDQVLHDDGS